MILLDFDEKIMDFGGFSSLEGRVSTPARSPGLGISFMMFIKYFKKLNFLNRKFVSKFFSKMIKNVEDIIENAFSCFVRVFYTKSMFFVYQHALQGPSYAAQNAKNLLTKVNYIF